METSKRIFVMNKEEARQLLEIKLNELKNLKFEEFSEWVLNKRVEVYEIKGSSGDQYQVEVEAHWDHEKNGDIRVLGSIDNGTFRAAFTPICADFLVSKSGETE